MGRTKGAHNKQPADHPEFLDMTVEERLEFITSLVVEQLLEELHSNSQLLHELGLEGLA